MTDQYARPMSMVLLPLHGLAGPRLPPRGWRPCGCRVHRRYRECRMHASLDGALSAAHLDDLLRQRFVQVSNYVSDAHVSALVRDIKGLRDSAPGTSAMAGHGSLQWFHFGPGGVSSGPPVPPDAGGDPAARARLVELIAGLKVSIEEAVGSNFDGDWTELQYGYYPNGGWYHRHIDCGPSPGFIQCAHCLHCRASSAPSHATPSWLGARSAAQPGLNLRSPPGRPREPCTLSPMHRNALMH